MERLLHLLRKNCGVDFIEELQRTNEEMHTAKEKLQSSHEELNTVNMELQSRNAELAQLNDRPDKPARLPEHRLS